MPQCEIDNGGAEVLLETMHAIAGEVNFMSRELAKILEETSAVSEFYCPNCG